MRFSAPCVHYLNMEPHRRRLPHIYPEGAPLFLTWHLHDSVPTWLKPPPGPLTSGEAFVWLDRRLDAMKSGPRYLLQPEVARIVVGCLQKGVVLRHYELDAWVIMPNHVHLLIRPLIAPELLLKSLKGASAREANKVLGRTGEPFWQKESYDHWVRNPAEGDKIRKYIENNPVKAGLVRTREEYLWSSGRGVETSLDTARTSELAEKGTDRSVPAGKCLLPRG